MRRLTFISIFILLLLPFEVKASLCIENLQNVRTEMERAQRVISLWERVFGGSPTHSYILAVVDVFEIYSNEQGEVEKNLFLDEVLDRTDLEFESVRRYLHQFIERGWVHQRKDRSRHRIRRYLVLTDEFAHRWEELNSQLHGLEGSVE